MKVFKFYDLLAIICLVVLGTNSLSALDIFLAEDLKTRKNYSEVLATKMSGEKPSFAGDMWPDVDKYQEATRGSIFNGIKSIQESIRSEQQHLKNLVESHA